jgi:hypothetical protein
MHLIRNHAVIAQPAGSKQTGFWQAGKVYIKVFWLTSIILSVLLTLVLNIIF